MSAVVQVFYFGEKLNVNTNPSWQSQWAVLHVCVHCFSLEKLLQTFMLIFNTNFFHLINYEFTHGF